MTELFESSPEDRRDAKDRAADASSRNAVVFAFFYIGFAAAVYFATRWLLPKGTLSGISIIVLVVGSAFWLYGKFLRRN